MDYLALQEFCENEEELTICKEMHRLRSQRNAAKKLRIAQSTLCSKLQKIRERTEKPPQDGNERWTEEGCSGLWEFNGTAEGINNLDDAIEFSKVDLDTWSITKHVFNKWPTTIKVKDGEGNFTTKQTANIQVKIWFERRADYDVDWDKTLEQLHKHIKSRKPSKAKSQGGAGLAACADFHFGAYVDDLIRGEKFSIKILVERMEAVAARINSYGKKEIHLALLGDFIESFTGLNHRNSWKGLAKGQFGINATILCFELMLESLILRIKGLKSISMVSGNHDRVTSDKELDPKGEVAEMLAYMFDRELRSHGIEVVFNPLVLTREIDGICYVMTHGHHKLASKDVSKILFDYGKQGMFNVIMQGHLHSRKIKKANRRHQLLHEEVESVGFDEVESRFVVVPSLFTGNFYSESMGFTSNAGFNWFENNGRGRIRFIDECI